VYRQSCAGDIVFTHLNNPLNPDPSLGQYPLDVLAALLRLVCDAALDQVALVIGGDLARDEDLGACDDGLGLFARVSVLRCYSSLALFGW
jgi:hypothetical protein